MKYSFCISIGLLFSFFGYAQDIHWTQFYENPIFLNPANSGNFKGDHRFIANYRDQWRSVTKPFQTISFCYDTKLKNPKFGLGVVFFKDQTGDGKFKTFELQVSPSYRFAISKDSLHRLQLGAQFALNHRQFTFSKFYFDEQFNGVSYDPTISNTENLQTDKKTNLSLGAGAVYQYYKSSRDHFSIGLSAFNINQPNQGFYGTKVKRDLRTNIFARFNLKLTDDFDAIPMAQFQFQGTYKEILAGGLLKLYLDHDINDYKALYAGFLFRSKDAFFFNLGIDYHTWYLGLSYDVNISSLKPASNGRGGLEISLRYIIHHFKAKKIQYRICPEYI